MKKYNSVFKEKKLKENRLTTKLGEIIKELDRNENNLNSFSLLILNSLYENIEDPSDLIVILKNIKKNIDYYIKNVPLL